MSSTSGRWSRGRSPTRRGWIRHPKGRGGNSNERAVDRRITQMSHGASAHPTTTRVDKPHHCSTFPFVCPRTTATSQLGPGHLLGSDPPGLTHETISGGTTLRTRLALVTSSHELSTTHLITTKATISHASTTNNPNHDKHELHRPSNDEQAKKSNRSYFWRRHLWRKIWRADQLIWNDHDHNGTRRCRRRHETTTTTTVSMRGYTIERNISVDQRSSSFEEQRDRESWIYVLQGQYKETSLLHP